MGLLAFGCPINNPDRAEKIWIDVNRLRFVNVCRHDWIMGIHVWAIESGILIGEDTVPETGLEVEPLMPNIMCSGMPGTYIGIPG